MESAQSRIEASQKQVEGGQIRMESMLRDFLATQQRKGTPIASCNLESSSPEGLNVCISLYNALRKEGITPQKIKDSQQNLVKAMKRTLGTSEVEAQSLASTFCASFATAPEYIDNSIPSTSKGRRSPLMNVSPTFTASSVEAIISLYGSAPPTKPNFPQAFLERSLPSALEAEDDLSEHEDQNSDNHFMKKYLADSRDSRHAEADAFEATDVAPVLSRTCEHHGPLDLDEDELRVGWRIRKQPGDKGFRGDVRPLPCPYSMSTRKSK